MMRVGCPRGAHRLAVAWRGKEPDIREHVVVFLDGSSGEVACKTGRGHARCFSNKQRKTDRQMGMIYLPSQRRA